MIDSPWETPTIVKYILDAADKIACDRWLHLYAWEPAAFGQ
jgi:hypothetical protein